MITSTANPRTERHMYLSLNEYDQLGREVMVRNIKVARQKALDSNSDIRDYIINALLIGIVAGLCFGLFLSSYIPH